MSYTKLNTHAHTQYTIHMTTIHRHTIGKGAIPSPSSMSNSYTRPHKHVIRILIKLDIGRW